MHSAVPDPRAAIASAPVEPDHIEQGAEPPAGERRLFPDEPSAPPRIREGYWSPDSDRFARRHGAGAREASVAGNGAAASRGPGPGSPAQQNGESRRTLHLSLPNGNGGGAPAESRPQPAASRGLGPAASPAPRQAAEPQFDPLRREPTAAMPQPSPLGAARGPLAAPGEAPRAKEAAAFIDQALRERIDGDIAAFLAAFDAALDHDTPESRTGLREATDRLLRAGARTRIELERLEARVPLAARDKNGQSPLLFRSR